MPGWGGGLEAAGAGEPPVQGFSFVAGGASFAMIHYKHRAQLGQGEWRPFVSTNTSTCNLQLSTFNLQP
jgi:hypothetical protein